MLIENLAFGIAAKRTITQDFAATTSLRAVRTTALAGALQLPCRAAIRRLSARPADTFAGAAGPAPL
ncbi:hypothetical protein FNJ84_20375 [Paracoccus sp. M683]|uniref:hypothetical protein n=1 Tax=Paracoccus sp. M683 TaxID=2594268 RepID=UPI00117C01BD|nr:hypothetical protein [Paracoccus sp. M683]TRW93156.1 hypothetical protein FNJ84_20375 [Paracoccus sp. M683]